MNENLKNDIEILFSKYPELKNSKLHFRDNGFDLEASTEATESTLQAPEYPCDAREPLPELIKGHSPKVEIRRSPIHGHGVFAKEPIESGELIEECKMLKLGFRARYNNDPVLRDYLWVNHSCNCSECQKHGAYQYMNLGLAVIYNHSDTPNTKQALNFKTEVMRITARNRIEKDEEIFVTYGKKYWVIRNIWKSLGSKTWMDFFENKSFPGK